MLRYVTLVSSTGRLRKRSILIAYDIFAMCLSLWGAFSARLGMLYWPDNPVVLMSAAASFLIGIGALYRLRVYHIVLRYFDLRTVSRVFFGAAVATITWVILIYVTRAQITVEGRPFLVPRSVGFIYCGFLFMLLFMGRYAMASLIAGAGRETSKPGHAAARNVAIYGANAAGISLANSVLQDPHYRLRAFVDDDAALHGQIIAGAPIYSPKSLPELVVSADLHEIFLAIPKATRSQRVAAIARLNQLNILVKTVPSPEEIVSGRFTISDVRPIDVNDLLRRDPVEPIIELIEDAVENRSILVTGAGGSIGSEICRQIARGKPTRLVLLDHSEFNLYSIEQQLLEIVQHLSMPERPDIIPIVGSMMNELLVRQVIRDHEIDTIYHAAAYKHVPLLEHNEVVGVNNNVIGTLVLAQAAFDAKLTRFTMISTDKAVRPKSVMGASKRAAELIIQAFADRPNCQTRFGIVRFGNVLDSSGSVVQLFRSQLGRGGPLTVTHPDVTRYFMSIPEATQLVLQASAMARNGEVFVLDMGDSIRISELARNMVKLSGMTVRDDNNPGGDIEITYVGLRPGEKLYEELFVGEDAADTAHPRVKMAKERSIAFQELEPQLKKLRKAIDAGQASQVRHILEALVAPDQEANNGQ